MESANNAIATANCHDCGKALKISNNKIIGGKILTYQHQDKKIQVTKCNACYKKNKALSNFQSCEVYSRIVGYYRPIQQWNIGKKEEYIKRQEFSINNSCCK